MKETGETESDSIKTIENAIVEQDDDSSEFTAGLIGGIIGAVCAAALVGIVFVIFFKMSKPTVEQQKKKYTSQNGKNGDVKNKKDKRKAKEDNQSDTITRKFPYDSSNQNSSGSGNKNASKINVESLDEEKCEVQPLQS